MSDTITLASLVARLRADLPDRQGWTSEHYRQILAVALAELGAAAGAIYRLSMGQTEVLAEHPVRADLPTPPALLWPVPSESRLFSQIVVPDGQDGWLGALRWQHPPAEELQMVIRAPQGSAPSHAQLSTVGALLALASENAHLRQARGREARQGDLVFRVSQAFMAMMDITQLPDLIVSLAAETLERAENCVLHLLDESKDQLVAVSASFADGSPSSHQGTPLRPGLGAAGLALQTGQVVNIGDVTRDERFLARPSSLSIASLLTAPLLVRAAPIGTLSVSSSIPYAFGEEDERLLMTLASLAAAAIDSADLVKSLQQSLNDLRDAQAQLLQSEKLSALGQLIAGIAHELNNPLAAISGYAQLLKMNADLDPQTRQDVIRIYEQAQRAARIVHNLLTFAREHRAIHQPTDINTLLQKSLELMAYQLRTEDITVDLRLAPQPLRVIGDPYQLQQVFFNLIGNARDAMTSAHGGGRLAVKTELDGATVRIRIADNGPGLTPEAKQHLFEPFFTTKEVGKGTGLGLSICFGIVSEHGGRIYPDETRRHGAEFVVEFPYTTRLPDADLGSTVDSPTFQTDQLVLLVEDDEAVCRVVQRVLAQDRHRAVVTRDGFEALDYLRRARDRGVSIALIISDIKMPNMDGDELYDCILRDHPELGERVLFITGDSISPSTRDFLGAHGLPFLSKPFDLDELRHAVREGLR